MESLQAAPPVRVIANSENFQCNSVNPRVMLHGILDLGIEPDKHTGWIYGQGTYESSYTIPIASNPETRIGWRIRGDVSRFLLMVKEHY